MQHGQAEAELLPFSRQKSLARAILIVEDRQSDIDLIEEAIQESKIPYGLYIVKNGEEALDFLYQKKQYHKVPRPDLILLDLNLPRINGNELLSIIKTDPKLRLIPVIVLSTSNSPSDITESYALHANCYLTKPSDLDRFFAVVQAIIQFWFTVAALPPA